MKTTEAWSAGIFPYSDAWMDAEQITRNRVKWRAAVHQLGDHWAFLRVQERVPPESAEKVRALRKATK